MSSLIYGHDAEIAGWVEDRIPHMFGNGFGPCSVLGVASNTGDLMAGVVFHDYQEELGTIQLSMAARNPMWARRSTIKDLLEYPFRQLGVYKVWTATPHLNEKALRVNKNIGFKAEATLAHHFGKNKHCVVSRMLLPDYNRIYGDT